ncbi:YitT family protein [Marinilactibacillus sp. Marseille-P9653]|uniref:YczE/YyaS/YitT family protein n=1 Tax=Marinilactibacillus sp. Marseille-P9653 TaxID=2866583 RepID=UPI001CE49266|nr:hypothetical protein [Marinilactibacillus sp. Marseille-P9653]
MHKFKRIALMVLSMTLVSLSASMTIKAAIGLSPWDAIAQSLSHISMIKVGTIGMILNISCVFGQLVLLRKEFPIRQLLQIPASVLIGVLVNYFYYTLFDTLVLPNYFMASILFFLGTLLAAFAVSMVMVVNVVTFPLEAFCMAFAVKIGTRFSIIRQSVDILAVILTLTLTFTLDIPLTVREGTIIGMLIFAPLLGIIIKRLQPLIDRPESKATTL